MDGIDKRWHAQRKPRPALQRFPQRELSTVANSHYGVTGADALTVG
jgi:hypothetical protein